MSQAVSAALIPSTSSVSLTVDTAGVVRHLTHELRQPLSAIESIAYYLEMVLPQTDTRALAQVERLQTLVEQMSWILSDAVHYIQAAEPQPQRLDLNEVVSEAIAEASGPGVSFDTRLSEDVAHVNLDPAQARHLARGLLTVFRHWSAPGAPVGISTFAGAGEVRLQVAARAVRLEPASLAEIFDPFTAHLPAGSGLALASAKRIAESHGGRAHAHCSGETGAVVEIVLPAAS